MTDFRHSHERYGPVSPGLLSAMSVRPAVRVIVASLAITAKLFHVRLLPRATDILGVQGFIFGVKAAIRVFRQNRREKSSPSLNSV